MNAGRRIAVAALWALFLVPATDATAAIKRPRPSVAPVAETSIAPNDFQIYNDYASPERTYSSQRAVIHYVGLGIDAPPLNDDDADSVPDYVERIGQAADRALAYYERRGFRPPRPDEAGPDHRPDIYVSRFTPGTLGVAFPASRAQGGAFAVVANTLDPSAERSFASLYGTVAHELFHLVQFSYFSQDADVAIPTWILEGTAVAMERRVNPDLDDLVSTIQLSQWFWAMDRSMTTQSYGAQLLWRRLDMEQPRFLPALFARLGARPVAGEGQHAVASTYARSAGKPFASAFHRFAVTVAADRPDDIKTGRAPRRAALAPLSIRYVRVAVPSTGRSTLTVSFPRERASAAATLVYQLESEIAGSPARTRRVAPQVTEHGGTLVFRVSAGSRKSAVLVLSNGGDRAVPYVVTAP